MLCITACLTVMTDTVNKTVLPMYKDAVSKSTRMICPHCYFVYISTCLRHLLLNTLQSCLYPAKGALCMRWCKKIRIHKEIALYM